MRGGYGSASVGRRATWQGQESDMAHGGRSGAGGNRVQDAARGREDAERHSSLGGTDPSRVKRLSTITSASLAVALAACLCGGWAAVSSQAAVAEAKANTQPTLTASVGIAAGDEVTADMLVVQDVPQAFRVEGALAGIQDQEGASVVGSRALVDIPAGSQLSAAVLSGTAGSGYLAAALDAGKQAITVAVDAETGLSGQLRPADAVRVVVIEDDAAGGAVASTVCESVRVVSLDDKLSGGEGGYTSVTLEVDRDQADAIRSAQHAGTVSLVLRSSADALAEGA